MYDSPYSIWKMAQWFTHVQRHCVCDIPGIILLVENMNRSLLTLDYKIWYEIGNGYSAFIP